MCPMSHLVGLCLGPALLSSLQDQQSLANAGHVLHRNTAATIKLNNINTRLVFVKTDMKLTL